MCPPENDNDFEDDEITIDEELVLYPDSQRELTENIEIAQTLQEEIVGEGPQEEANKAITPQKPLALMERSADLRMAAFLAEPIKTRSQAMRFLETLMKLVDERMPMGSAKVRNSDEYIDGAVNLADGVGQLRGQIATVRNMMRTTLKMNPGGAVEYSMTNMTSLQIILKRAAESLDRLKDTAHFREAWEPGDVSYMKPPHVMVDTALRLGRLQGPTQDGSLIIDTFKLLGAHLSSIVQGTQIGVEMDRHHSVRQFHRVLGDVTETANRITAAEAEGEDITPEEIEAWERLMTNIVFATVQVDSRAEHLYQPNADDFLQMIDIGALEKRARYLESSGRILEERIRNQRTLQASTLKRVGNTLGSWFLGREKQPIVPIGNLTMQQKEMRQKIRAVAAALKKRKRLEA